MTRFFDVVVGTSRNQKSVFTTVLVVGALLGFGSMGTTASPERVTAVAIYLGSFITLTLGVRALGGTFHDVGASLAQFETNAAGLFLQHLALAAALAGMARILMTLVLAPFQFSAGVSVVLDPLLLGLPLDVLILSVLLALNAVLRRGGAALAFVVVFAAGAVGTEAAIDPDFFGAAAPVLTLSRFPWIELRGIPEALAEGQAQAAMVGTLRLVAYWAGWTALGVFTLHYRATRGSGPEKAAEAEMATE